MGVQFTVKCCFIMEHSVTMQLVECPYTGPPMGHIQTCYYDPNTAMEGI